VQLGLCVADTVWELLALLFTYNIFHSYFERHNCLWFVQDSWLLAGGLRWKRATESGSGGPAAAGAWEPRGCHTAAGMSVHVAVCVSVRMAAGPGCRAGLQTEPVAPSAISPGPRCPSGRRRVGMRPREHLLPLLRERRKTAQGAHRDQACVCDVDQHVSPNTRFLRAMCLTPVQRNMPRCSHGTAQAEL